MYATMLNGQLMSFTIMLDGVFFAGDAEGFFADRKRHLMYLIVEGRRVYVNERVNTNANNPAWDARMRTLRLTSVKE